VKIPDKNAQGRALPLDSGLKMRGIVTWIMPDDSYGQILAGDGHRYSYWTSELRNGPVQIGQTVEFQIWHGQPIDIHIADREPLVLWWVNGENRSALSPKKWMNEFPISKGYWVRLLILPSGRISRRQFWLHGFLPIFLFNLLLSWIPLIGQLIALSLFWASICIGFKRFHDHGYPGWYSLASTVPATVGAIVFVFGIWNGSDQATLLGEILWGIAMLVGLAQIIFVYIRIGEFGPNEYGPDPLTSEPQS
jgi:uncharacterized membrane protein YhaH (DUF805 family)